MWLESKKKRIYNEYVMSIYITKACEFEKRKTNVSKAMSTTKLKERYIVGGFTCLLVLFVFF